MPARAIAYVSSQMLRWAREQAACNLDDAAKIVGRPRSVVADWESSESDALPTVRQAQKLADAYGIPFALLYLERPLPELTPEAVPEFRGLDPELGQVRPHSRQLRRMITQAQGRQAFAIELLAAAGQPLLPWVGSAIPDEDTEALGSKIRTTLEVVSELPSPQDLERILDQWVERVETLGAIVSRYRPDGNRYWVVEPSEARGLSLCHPFAPYIVLNSRDAPAGRIFTLMHELAHLYFGQCGIDDMGNEELLPSNARFLEQRCNQLAAAILMPAATFAAEWNSAEGEMRDKVQAVAGRFGVSRQAVAVRAKSDVLSLISPGEYASMFGYFSGEYREFRDSRALASGGGGMSVPVRTLKDYGARYLGLVFDAQADGRMSLLDTSEALNVRVGDVDGIRGRLR